MRKVQRHDYKVVLTYTKNIVPNLDTLIEVRYKRIRGYTLRVTNDTYENKKVILTANTILNRDEAEKILNKYNDFLLKCFDENKTFHLSSLKENQYMLFGKIYEVVIQNCKEAKVIEDKIITPSKEKIDILGFNTITNLYEEVVKKYNFPHTTLKYRKMKSRWGVCYFQKKEITLTKALIHVPIECVYQVICHELTHLKVTNHGPLFHKELQRICPNERELNKRIREFSEFLYE